MPLGFHWYELIPLVLIALLIFGPKKLPELGSSIGKTIKEFQKSMPDAFQAVVLRMLAKRPEDRYTGSAPLVADLEAVAAVHAEER